MDVDLVLSSGFLAFARHAGFLAAVEECGARVQAVCGTSSGSVCAALWAAGMPAADVAKLFTGVNLMTLGRPNTAFWSGALRMDAFADFLRPHLPERFSGLRMPLAVGVVDMQGHHRLLTDGPLVEAVAASCAMPGIFRGVQVGNGRFRDGGAADRLGLSAHRAWRRDTRVVAHWVERSAGRDVEVDLNGVVVVRTPRSGAQFWSLGDVAAQVEEARGLARKALQEAGWPARAS